MSAFHRTSPCLSGLLALAALLLGPQGVGAFIASPPTGAQKYLIIASPSTGTIAYLDLPSSGAPAAGSGTVKKLITSGLTFPQGLAVDEYRQMLYVADPNLKKLVGYSLGHSGSALTVGSQKDIATGVEVRAVAVDGIGDVYMTDERAQKIYKVTWSQISAGSVAPTVVYDTTTMPALRAPGGIITDNFFVYWLNKAQGTTLGSLVRAPQKSPPIVNNVTMITGDEQLPQVLASNSPKCYGVCMALGNIYYTDDFNFYGVPRAATARDEFVTVSTAMQEPRGCVYDGDGTVYVADKVANTVYQFAANKLQAGAPLAKAATYDGAYGLALYTRVD